MTCVGLAPSAGAAPGQSGGTASVEVTIETGVGGVVSDAVRVPVRALLTADRSRTVRVELTTDLGRQYYELALNADAPTPLDAVIQSPLDRVELEVTDLDGKKVGGARADIEVDPDRIVVGIGRSIAGHAEPWDSPTVAGIQNARLVPLTSDLLDRPGVLGMLSGIVLAPADVENLTETQARHIGAWVAVGGNLALDQARSDPLPVLGSDAEPGDRTAVDLGWVRFTNGLAATGDWSAVVEPGLLPDSGNNNGGMVDMGFGPGMGVGFTDSVFDEQLRHTGFLQISYLSSGVIIAAVFVTALLVGPVLWMLLRSRTRRRWMWLLAPSLSVAIAALLLTAGQGALSDATTSAIGSGVSSAWATQGEFGFGTTSDQGDIDLGTEGQVWASSPRVRVNGSGADRSATQDIGINSFGYVGLGVVDVADTAVVSVRAVAKADGKVTVSVTNNTDGPLTDVYVRGFSRVRGFSDVEGGATETLDFEASDDLSTFAPEFPLPNDVGIVCMENFCTDPNGGAFGRKEFPTASARGRVEIWGTLQTEVTVGGHEHETTMKVTSRAAVVADPGDPATAARAARIESVGPRVLGRNDGAFGVIDVGPPVPIPPGPLDPNAVPTTTMLFDINGRPVGPDGTPLEPSLPVVPPTTVYARLSVPGDVASLRCSVHTVLGTIDVWRDGAWTPVPTAGEPAPNPAFNEPNETRDYDFGEVKAGATLILRATAGLAVNPAPAFHCGGPT